MKVSKWLVDRMNKILSNKDMNSQTADELQRLLNEWRKNNVKSQIKDIDEEIARLNAAREELVKWQKKTR